MNAHGSSEDQHHELRVLELFSGIGGMHAALSAAAPHARVIGAFDINNVANKVYRYNFPMTKVHQRLIESIPQHKFDEELQADMYLMSPPCQPFTRTGNQKGITDKRSTSLSYILKILAQCNQPPRYLLMENVKGFESSNAREPLVSTLTEKGYSCQEFILSPDQFGIPNSRQRYFLVAVLKPFQLPFKPTETVLFHIPTLSGTFNLPYSSASCKASFLPPHPEQVPGTVPTRPWIHCPVKPLSTFLDTSNVSDEHLIPLKVVIRRGRLFDIVDGASFRTMCFTKAYSHYAEGTGSVVLDTRKHTLDTCVRLFEQLKDRESGLRTTGNVMVGEKEEQIGEKTQHCEHSKLKLPKCSSPPETPTVSDTPSTRFTNNDGSFELVHEQLAELHLRWFTPQEMLRIHGFPDSFSVPEDVTPKQMRRCIGNSLNVIVVRELIRYALASSEYIGDQSSFQSSTERSSDLSKHIPILTQVTQDAGIAVVDLRLQMPLKSPGAVLSFQNFYVYQLDCLVEVGGDWKPILTELPLMASPHHENGAQDTIYMHLTFQSNQHKFENTKQRQINLSCAMAEQRDVRLYLTVPEGIKHLQLILTQPSPLWKTFGIRLIRCYCLVEKPCATKDNSNTNDFGISSKHTEFQALREVLSAAAQDPP